MLYPVDLPLDSIKIIVDDIRGSKIGTDSQKFAKAVWELSGYALKSSIGEPNVSFIFTQLPPVETLSDEQVAGYLVNTDLIAMLPWRAILKWSLLRIAELL